MHRIFRPTGYKKPSFASAYAKAAGRYKMGVGAFPTYAYDEGEDTVVRVHSIDNVEHSTKVPAASHQTDFEYTINVKVGTPGVMLRLVPDTGSADFWVWSSELRDTEGHAIYEPTESSTSKKTESTWLNIFGDSQRGGGDVYIDTVTVGDIVIPDQAIQRATKLNSELRADQNIDGYMGLAWSKINRIKPNPMATIVENMIDKNLIDLPVFTCKLARSDESEASDRDAGFFSFGYIEPAVTDQHLNYTSVDSSRGLWEVPSASYSINGKRNDRPNATCAIDTGSTLVFVEDSVLSQIYGNVEGATFDHQLGGWKYPENATVPELEFAIGDKLYKMSRKDFAYGPSLDGFHFGAIQSRGSLSFDVLGIAFLKSVYVVFNPAEATVGIAQRDE